MMERTEQATAGLLGLDRVSISAEAQEIIRLACVVEAVAERLNKIDNATNQGGLEKLANELNQSAADLWRAGWQYQVDKRLVDGVAV